jgi:hypothetical protein
MSIASFPVLGGLSFFDNNFYEPSSSTPAGPKDSGDSSIISKACRTISADGICALLGSSMSEIDALSLSNLSLRVFTS